MAAKKVKREKAPIPEAMVGEVRVTNPDKLLYPDCGITKREVAAYYLAVSRWMMPYIVGHPITFVRFQKGWKAGGFFQKHAKGGIAKGVRSFRIPGGDDVLLVDDAKTLVGCAQMNVLEFHVANLLVEDWKKPTMLVLDLDPDPSVEWKTVVETAHLVREKLAAKGHVPLVKTTGGKGLHVCFVPPKDTTWKEAHEIGRALGEEMETDAPDRFVTNISKAKRKGKILLDFSRNHPGTTFVAPYSLRGRANAPVAMPLEWDELDRAAPLDFTLRTTVARLESKGDPWSGVAHTAR